MLKQMHDRDLCGHSPFAWHVQWELSHCDIGASITWQKRQLGKALAKVWCTLTCSIRRDLSHKMACMRRKMMYKLQEWVSWTRLWIILSPEGHIWEALCSSSRLHPATPSPRFPLHLHSMQISVQNSVRSDPPYNAQICLPFQLLFITPFKHLFQLLTNSTCWPYCPHETFHSFFLSVISYCIDSWQLSIRALFTTKAHSLFARILWLVSCRLFVVWLAHCLVNQPQTSYDLVALRNTCITDYKVLWSSQKNLALCATCADLVNVTQCLEIFVLVLTTCWSAYHSTSESRMR